MAQGRLFLLDGKGADRVRKKWKMLLMAGMALLLSGCFFRPADDLYQLPERLAGYDNLDRSIKEIRADLEQRNGVSSEYAVIFAGENTSTIQLQDLDGDGERETAVTFLRLPGAEKPIKICFFTRHGEDEFRFSGMIEGEGTAVYRVDFADLNNQGLKETVVSWQLGTGVYQLGVYTLDGLNAPEYENDELTPPPAAMFDPSSAAANQLLLTTYNRYALLDLDRDTRIEVALARLDPGGNGSALEVYGWSNGAISMLSSVSLSAGMSSIDSMQSSFVADSLLTPALYVCSTLAEGGRAVDIVAYRDGVLSDLTMNPSTGVSKEILRGSGQQELADINGDYVLEVPVSTPLPSAGEGASDFWLTQWGQYDLSGRRTVVATTYHNRTDGWYLEIPEDWVGQLTISRTDRAVGQREVIFSRWKGEGKEPERFLAIYKLTGPNRSAWARTTNRFILQEDDDTIYAATLLYNSWDCGLDEAGLRERFHLIG